jgi:hypothetical protein
MNSKIFWRNENSQTLRVWLDLESLPRLFTLNICCLYESLIALSKSKCVCVCVFVWGPACLWCTKPLCVPTTDGLLWLQELGTFRKGPA